MSDTDGSVLGAGLPRNLRGGIATIMFKLPVVKHNYAWAGCFPAGDVSSKGRPCWGTSSISAPHPGGSEHWASGMSESVRAAGCSS